MPKILDVLTDPDRFFEEKLKEEVSLKVPFFIVLIIGALSSISAYFTYSSSSQIFESMPAEIAPFVPAFTSLIMIFGVIMAIISPFLSWLVCAAIFHLITFLFNGTGKFIRTLEFVGYGFIPSIFGSAIMTVINAYMMQSQTFSFPTEFSMEDPELWQQSMMSNMGDPALLLAPSIVGIIFLLWSAFIWRYGVKHARNLSRSESLMTVGLVVGIYVAFTLLALLYIWFLVSYFPYFGTP